MDVGGLQTVDRNVEGVVEMMLDATQNFKKRLTQERLFGWHAALFPTARSGMRSIKVGGWRTDDSGPMQVVSGPLGREHVHYEAPSAERLPQEMSDFLDWFEGENERDWIVKAGLAHLWFVTIHPFEDGNGRIARAIADMALARSKQTGAVLQHVCPNSAGTKHLLRDTGTNSEGNSRCDPLDGVVLGLFRTGH